MEVNIKPAEYTPSPEKSPARTKLEILEASEKYLFHGSPTAGITEFEPRQAVNNTPPQPDGSPAVFASEKADIAIFRAIINKSRVDPGKTYSSSWDNEGEDMIFKVNQSTYDTVVQQDVIGYVYIFDRSLFHRYRGHEWRCEQPVLPELVVKVKVVDLPQEIVKTK